MNDRSFFNMEHADTLLSEVVNSLWPSDTIWWLRSGSMLAQVMACCLTAPSHYLKQCWLIITKEQWHSSDGSFTRDAPATNHWNYFENHLHNFFSNLPGVNELIFLYFCLYSVEFKAILFWPPPVDSNTWLFDQHHTSSITMDTGVSRKNTL